jgi:hypothetical protein
MTENTNVIEIKKNINIIINKIKELRLNNITDDYELEKYFIEDMPEFYDNYSSIVKKLCKTKNFKTELIYLYKMLNILDDYSEDKEKNLAEELATEFLYPNINKKN